MKKTPAANPASRPRLVEAKSWIVLPSISSTTRCCQGLTMRRVLRSTYPVSTFMSMTAWCFWRGSIAPCRISSSVGVLPLTGTAAIFSGRFGLVGCNTITPRLRERSRRLGCPRAHITPRQESITMKLVRVTGTVAVLLFAGMMIPVHAQRGGQGDKQGEQQGKPDKPQGRQEGSAPQQQQRAQQPQQQQKQRQQPQQQPQQRAQQPQQQQQQQRQQPQQQPQQQQQQQQQHAQQPQQPAQQQQQQQRAQQPQQQ